MTCTPFLLNERSIATYVERRDCVCQRCRGAGVFFGRKSSLTPSSLAEKTPDSVVLDYESGRWQSE